MKTTNLVATLILLLTSLSSIAIVRKTEYPLRLLATPVTFERYQTDAGEFSKFFRRNAQGPKPPTAPSPYSFGTYVHEVILTKDLLDLEEKLDDKDMTEGQFFRALRIFYALGSNNVIYLIYLPDHAIQQSFVMPNITFKLTTGDDILNLNDATKVYTWNKNDLKIDEVDLSIVRQDIKNYRNQIWINHSDGEAAGGFRNTDVEGVMYSFQELKSFSSFTKLYLTSVLFNSAHVTGYNIYRKHDLMLANIAPDDAATHDQIANLATMCPVNCPDITAHFDVLRSDKIEIITIEGESFKDKKGASFGMFLNR